MTTERLRLEYESLRDSLDKQLPKECGNCSDTTELHMHHIVPLSFGGSNRVSNIARLCNVCHSKAHGGYALIEKAAETKKSNVANGKRFASKILYGYKYEDGRYLIEDDNAEVIRLIFSLRYKSEYSTVNVAEILNYLAIPTAGASKKWSHPVVARMIKNPQYLGKCVYAGVDLGDIYPAIIDGELADSIPKFEAKYKGRRLPPRNLQAYFDSLNASQAKH